MPDFETGIIIVVSLLVIIGFGNMALVSAAMRYPEVAARVRWLFDPPADLYVDYGVGDLDRALAGARALRPAAPGMESHFCVARVNISIAAGEYSEALRVKPRGISTAAMRANFASNYALVVINKAEALYNLGRWRRAEQLMAALGSSGVIPDDLCLVGALTQLAWICVRTGRADAAAWWLEAVDPTPLPREYRAEVFFTRAVTALELGDLAGARRHLDDSRRHLIRASSRRNERFLRARVEAAAGSLHEAVRLCEAASEMRFRGQGGDGLVLWGDLLKQLGDEEGARRAWRLAIERDPNGEWAREAHDRLAPPSASA